MSTGERVLEVGFGTGHALARFSDAVGPTGHVHGLDISEGMTAVALARVRAQRNVTVTIGDARALCMQDAVFDVAFMSFTLELFDAAAIPLVLANVRNVLRPGRRLGVVAMAKTVQTNAIVEICIAIAIFRTSSIVARSTSLRCSSARGFARPPVR